MTPRMVVVVALTALALSFSPACTRVDDATASPPTPVPQPAPAAPPRSSPVGSEARAATQATRAPSPVTIPRELQPAHEAGPACCRHCHKGKACGNTCISRRRECHIDGGCACDD